MHVIGCRDCSARNPWVWEHTALYLTRQMAMEKVKATPRQTQHMHWLLPGCCIRSAFFPVRYKHFIDSWVKFHTLSHLGSFTKDNDFHHRTRKLNLMLPAFHYTTKATEETFEVNRTDHTVHASMDGPTPLSPVGISCPFLLQCQENS